MAIAKKETSVTVERNAFVKPWVSETWIKTGWSASSRVGQQRYRTFDGNVDLYVKDLPKRRVKCFVSHGSFERSLVFNRCPVYPRMSIGPHVVHLWKPDILIAHTKRCGVST